MRLDSYRKPKVSTIEAVRRSLWYVFGRLFVETSIPWPSTCKRGLLVLFGARIGRGVVIKPHVKIKYPWLLRIGDYTWIGEHVWIDTVGEVTIGSHVCLSQGVYLCTGSHDYTDESFSLVIKPIVIEDEVWVCARASVCPGVRIASGSIVSLGSVVCENTTRGGIYRGNPAQRLTCE